VKNYLLYIILLALLSEGIASCSGSEQNSPDSLAQNVKEKKKPEPPKQKKKSRKKTTTAKKKMAPAAYASNKESGEPDATDNLAVRMLLVDKVSKFAARNDYSTKICFLVDMSIPSGRNRFFVYDLGNNSILFAGLVAHGSCNERFISRPRFSDKVSSGCTSVGKYKVGEFYVGKYGKSFRLYGLDNSNSNAYKRAVVIHGYDCVPDEEIYPRVLCNSLGCVMVSYRFFDKISRLIKKSDKPIVLWLYG